MIKVSHNYFEAAQDHRAEVVLSVWTTPRGRYLYSNVFPSEEMLNYFGNIYFWDGADLTLGSGQTWGGLPVCEYGARILNPGSIRLTLSPIKGDLFVSLGQTERGAISIEYDNSDDYFSELWGAHRNEVFHFQQHEIYHGFVGLAPADFVKLLDTEIIRLRYNKQKAIVVSIAQSRVYEVITKGDALPVYALTVPGIDSHTRLLIHSNTFNGDTTFTDSSSYGQSLIAQGSSPMSHSTAQAKFGTSSMIGAPATYDYIQGPKQTWLSATAGCMDWWQYWTGGTGTQWVIYQLARKNLDSGIWWEFNSDRFYVGYGGISNLILEDTGFTNNVWQHYAITWENGVIRLFRNGTLIGVTTDGSSITPSIAANYMQACECNFGYLDEIRASDVVRWTSDFLPYSLPYGESSQDFAQSTYSHAACTAAFFTSDNWVFDMNFKKAALGEACELFTLENNGTVTTLKIGITINNFVYVTTGQSVEGTPATTTYTDTQALTSAILGQNIHLHIKYSHADSEITFTINGVGNTQAATSPYDRTGTNNERITLGHGLTGSILNMKFNEIFYLQNNQGDATLASIPDVVGALDLTVQDAGWELWT